MFLSFLSFDTEIESAGIEKQSADITINTPVTMIIINLLTKKNVNWTIPLPEREGVHTPTDDKIKKYIQ